jgi:GTP-binding protein Era
VENNTKNSEQKFGFVAVIGEPNAGKSTLINNMVGTKVSIVSPKVQTTRTRVLGIAIENNAQIVFVDTPGIFKASQKNKMERAIVASAWEGIANAEVILLLVDASKKIGESTKIILDRLKKEEQNKTGKRFILVLNKIDKIKRDMLLDLSLRLNEAYDFEATFMLSALKGHGIQDMLEYLEDKLPEGQWHFPEDQVTDMPMRLMAAEVTREKLFKMMHQELPYQLTVETEDWEPFNDGSIKINQTIFITREAHKKIILGKSGSMIKKIGQISREELEDILETCVHLKLFVKVRENWLDDEERYAIWGLDLNA